MPRSGSESSSARGWDSCPPIPGPSRPPGSRFITETRRAAPRLTKLSRSPALVRGPELSSAFVATFHTARALTCAHVILSYPRVTSPARGHSGPGATAGQGDSRIAALHALSLRAGRREPSRRSERLHGAPRWCGNRAVAARGRRRALRPVWRLLLFSRAARPPPALLPRVLRL